MRKTFNILGIACLWAALAGNGQAVEVAHYAFESTLTDSATADGSQDLTLFGDAQLTSPGIVGEGKLSFDGSGDYATASGTNGFTSGAAGVTLSTWFTTATILPNTQHVLIQMPITGGAGLQQSAVGLEISSGKLQVGGRSATSEGFQFNDATLPSNTLVLNSTTTYFAAAVIDYANDFVTAYLYDGAEWKSQAVQVAFTNDVGPGNLGLSIGRRSDGQRPYNGSMDDVHIFTNVLTEAELQDMAGYVPPGADGDFDDDGDVDGRDFLVWQRGESPSSLSAEDLAAWADAYGAAPGLAAVTAVPEPTSIAMAIAALSMLLAFDRRRGEY
jgi:hypothetical protein